MLDKYIYEQPILYKMLSNAIKNEKLSHAYLFETNNNSNSLDIIYSFVKEIMCPRNISCENCSICSRIDNGNYLDLKVINPDGMQIKKEQMSELQDEFSKVSIESNRKVYIINECEKMNLQASNSILKFLEEPVDNIIAILVTNNINKVLSTIVSRCQVISLNKNNYDKSNNSFENVATILTNSNSEKEEFILNERKKELFNSVINFIDIFEVNKLDTIIFLKKIWYDIFKDRQDNIFAMDVLINFYYDVLKYIINGQVSIFVEQIDLIKKISCCSLEDISYKLEIFIDVRNLIEKNLNINLLIDYMIIKCGRRWIYGSCWCQI